MRSGKGTVGLIVGILLGVPLSYYFQSGVIRAKLSLGAYLTNLPELLSNYPGDIGLPLVLTCAVAGAAGWFVGSRLMRQREQ